MSLRREMLQVARLAPTLLGDSRDLVSGYLHRSLNPDGGFADRSGASDLYYTVFGLEGLLALGETPPGTVARFLQPFGDGQDLDLVHLSCLARAWKCVAPGLSPGDLPFRMRERVEAFRAADGGYAVTRAAGAGTPYGCFLAVGAIEDLGMPLPDPDPLLRCLAANRAVDGGYANHPAASEGSTPATAAAVLVLRHLDAVPDGSLSAWLLGRAYPAGGFFAAPRAPMPDLLSTATALHALAALQADVAALREPCLDFVDSLWMNSGGFCGSWADPVLDCEYTYYGLLALGHLSLV